jgi:hypothetical protein
MVFDWESYFERNLKILIAKRSRLYGTGRGRERGRAFLMRTWTGYFCVSLERLDISNKISR